MFFPYVITGLAGFGVFFAFLMISEKMKKNFEDVVSQVGLVNLAEKAPEDWTDERSKMFVQALVEVEKTRPQMHYTLPRSLLLKSGRSGKKLFWYLSNAKTKLYYSFGGSLSGFGIRPNSLFVTRLVSDQEYRGY